MIETDFLRQLERFNIVIKRRVNSAYAGSRQSDVTGSSLVFKDYRDYVPGDDFRAIDWRVYARTDKFYVRQYEDERNMVINIIIDSSASMNYGTVKKFDYAAMLGLGFAHMAMKNNEKFVISTFGDKLNTYRPKKGTNQLVHMLQYLKSRKVSGHSNFQESLSQYHKMLHSRSLIVFISDFLFDPKELKETLYRFRKHEIFVVQVLDGSERDLQVKGDLLLKDSETDTVVRTFISSRLKKTYTDKLHDHIAGLANACTDIHGKFVSVNTDTPIFDTFYEVLYG